jgi:hypothetical protein
MTETPEDLERAIAKLEQIRAERLEARQKSPDYAPLLLWTHPAHDRGLVVTRHIADNPRDAGRDFITITWSGDSAEAMRHELTTAVSRAAYEAGQAKREAAELAARQTSAPVIAERPTRDGENAGGETDSPR